MQGPKGAHPSEPLKAHLTGESVVVTGGSMLATVVSEAVSEAVR